MARNIGSVKGIRAILDEHSDNLIETLRKAIRSKSEMGGEDLALKIDGGLYVEGDFGIDRDGSVNFNGTVMAQPSPLISAAVPVGLTLGGGPKRKWKSKTAGRMAVWYRVEAVLGGGVSERDSDSGMPNWAVSRLDRTSDDHVRSVDPGGAGYSSSDG